MAFNSSLENQSFWSPLVSYKLDISKLVAPKPSDGFQRLWSLKLLHNLGVMFMLLRSQSMLLLFLIIKTFVETPCTNNHQ